MAKSPKVEGDKGDIELHPDAWERFERAVKVVAKAPPQHRKATPAAKPQKPKPKSDRA